MHGPSHGGNSFHSSSSSSSGSSFSFGSGSSGNGFNYNRTPLPPRRISFFGRPLFILPSLFNWVLPCIVFAIFSIIGLCIGAAETNENVKQIKYMEEDAVEFEQIIDTAVQEIENDDYYLFTINDIYFEADSGVFEDGYTYFGFSYRPNNNVWVVANYVLTYDGLDYYQLFYSFDTGDESGHKVRGLTYAQYSENQIINFQRLQIAYRMEGQNVTSINADYSLSENIEYLDYKDSYKVFVGVIVVASIVFLGFTTGAILLFVFAVKKGKKQMELQEQTVAANTDKTNAEAEAIRAETLRKNRNCPYCGSAIPDGDTICPGCGSRQID